jgi:hypothetical protein
MWAMSWRYSRRLAWVLAPVVLTLYVATFYCRYHYLTDTVVGIATAAAATVASPLLSKGWFALNGAEIPGYFEREFGITDALCRKVLAEAMTKGGEYADLFFEHTISNYLILEDGSRMGDLSSQSPVGTRASSCRRRTV